MEEFNSLSARLSHIVDMSGKTKTKFAADCDVNPSNFSKMLKGELGVSFTTAKKIEKVYGYSADWLLKRRGEMIVQTWRPEGDKTYGIPYYDELPVSAGSFDLATIPVNERPTKYVTFPGLSEGQFAFPVIGCSMEPLIKAGDVIVVSEVNNWERVDPDKTYMIVTEDDRMIKHLSADNEDSSILWCISENENYSKFRILKSEIKRVYRVVFHGSLL